MGFLGRLFGGGESLDNLRKAIADQRFADARLIAESLATQTLAQADAEEVESLRIAAGDGLARLNLDEALGFRRSGNEEQAGEHFHLALEQVCSADLRGRIEELKAEQAMRPEIDSAATERPLSCQTCSPVIPASLADNAIDISDQDDQLELILTSYPSDLVERYRAKGEHFQTAFLLSHAGNDDQALALWEKIDGPDQDDLYAFELGSLLARTGKLEEACKLLEQALTKNPGLLLAVEALTSVLTALGQFDQAEKCLYQCLDQELDPAFCHAQLTSLLVRQKKLEDAVEQARLGLSAGNTETSFMLLAASILEHHGDIDEAEAVLKRLPAGGCGGGVNLPLAEFWLRHKRELGRILDTFNAACREDPQNPRWQLRVAQTYLARNWRKDGMKLLKKVAGDPRLDPELAKEAEQLLTDQMAG